MNGVVPISVECVRRNGDAFHLGVGDFTPVSYERMSSFAFSVSPAVVRTLPMSLTTVS